MFKNNKQPTFMPNLASLIGDSIHGKDAQLIENNKKFAMERIQICAVEISPVCDHAQKKIGFAKFITGFVVPAEDVELKSKLNVKGQYLKQIGPFAIESASGSANFYMYLNSRFVATSSLKEAAKLRASCRMRSELLADVQFWASYQGARQGIMMLA